MELCVNILCYKTMSSGGVRVTTSLASPVSISMEISQASAHWLHAFRNIRKGVPERPLLRGQRARKESIMLQRSWEDADAKAQEAERTGWEESSWAEHTPQWPLSLQGRISRGTVGYSCKNMWAMCCTHHHTFPKLNPTDTSLDSCKGAFASYSWMPSAYTRGGAVHHNLVSIW